MKTAIPSDFISRDQVLKNLNIKPDELEDVDVEF